MPRQASENNQGLTLREAQVLKKAAEGKSNKIIGSELGIAKGTVKGHLSKALAKTGYSDRCDLILRFGVTQEEVNSSQTSSAELTAREEKILALLRDNTVPLTSRETVLLRILAEEKPLRMHAKENPRTIRELEILEFMSLGDMSNKAIKEKFNISLKTADAHVTSIMKKLGERSRATMVVHYLQKKMQNTVPAPNDGAQPERPVDANTDVTAIVPSETQP